MHIAKQHLSRFQVGFANFFDDVGHHIGEVGTGAEATVTASIEYPVGSFTATSCNKSSPGQIASDSYILCDASVEIPTNSRFWIREWYSNPAGIIGIAYGSQAVNAGYDDFSFGDAVEDKTLGGDIVEKKSSSHVQSYPIAIVTDTNIPSVCIWGDSRAFGFDDVRDDYSGDNGEVARYVGQKYPYILLGGPGDTAIETLRSTSNRVRLTNDYCTIAVDEYGLNDLSSKSTSSELINARRGIASLFTGVRTIGTTIPGEDFSTDSFKSQAGQTPAPINRMLQQFNRAVRNGISGEVSFVDIADAVDPSRSGRFPTNGTPFATTPDGVHETDILSVKEKNSKVWENFDLIVNLNH